MSKLYGLFDGVSDVGVGAWLKDSTFAWLVSGMPAADSAEAFAKSTTFGGVEECSAACRSLTVVVAFVFVLTRVNTTLWPFPAPPVLFTTVTAALAMSAAVWAFVAVNGVVGP